MQVASLKSKYAQSLFDSVQPPPPATSVASPANGSTAAAAAAAAPAVDVSDDAAKGAGTSGAGCSSAGSSSGGGGTAAAAGEKSARDAKLKARWREKFTVDAASDDAIDLLHGLMRYHPDHRLTAGDAMLHAYCAVFHDDAAAADAESTVTTEGFADNEKKSVHMYREKLYKMVDVSHHRSNPAALRQGPSASLPHAAASCPLMVSGSRGGGAGQVSGGERQGARRATVAPRPQALASRPRQEWPQAGPLLRRAAAGARVPCVCVRVCGAWRRVAC